MYDPGHCIHIDNLRRKYYHTITVLQPRGKTPGIFLYYSFCAMMPHILVYKTRWCWDKGHSTPSEGYELLRKHLRAEPAQPRALRPFHLKVPSLGYKQYPIVKHTDIENYTAEKVWGGALAIKYYHELSLPIRCLFTLIYPCLYPPLHLPPHDESCERVKGQGYCNPNEQNSEVQSNAWMDIENDSS